MSASPDLEDLPSEEPPGQSSGLLTGFSSYEEPSRNSPPPVPDVSELEEPLPHTLISNVSSQKRPRWKRVFVIFAVVLIAYGILHQKHNATSQAPPPAGWNDLIGCSFTTSLDGRRTLSLSEDQTAEVATSSGDHQTKQGKWNYDAASGKYEIVFGNEVTNYSLIASDDIGTCLLVNGDLNAANLLQSWFATIPDEPDYEPQEYER